MDSSIISITSTTSSRSPSPASLFAPRPRNATVQAIPDAPSLPTYRSFKGAFPTIEPAPKCSVAAAIARFCPPPRDAATQTPPRPLSLCPYCHKEVAPWNENGGYRCDMCEQLICCNRGKCLVQAEEDILDLNIRCPLCRAPGSFTWYAGGISPIKCNFSHRHPRGLAATISARYEDYDALE